MGWLSLILLELNIMSLYQRSMMFCTEWLDRSQKYGAVLNNS